MGAPEMEDASARGETTLLSGSEHSRYSAVGHLLAVAGKVHWPRTTTLVELSHQSAFSATRESAESALLNYEEKAV